MSTEQASWAERLGWTFGDRIRKIRRAVDADQSEFAATLGEKRESLSSWESGRVAQPRNVVAIAKRIELAYGVPAAWTLGLETELPGPGGPGNQQDEAPRTGLEPVTLWSTDSRLRLVAA